MNFVCSSVEKNDTYGLNQHVVGDYFIYIDNGWVQKDGYFFKGHKADWCKIHYGQDIKKIISSESGLSMDVLLTGNITANQWDTFNSIESKLSESNLYVYDKSPITIETLINKTKAIQASKDIDLIVVDYLQLLMTSNKAPSNSDSRAASMTYISNLLKGLAKDIGCPLISLSQLNRGVEARTDKRPVLSDLRDSGSIEQDADMVIMLYRQEYYDSLDTGLAEVIIRKNRLGETGDFELSFDGARSRFVDPEEEAFGRRKEYGPI